MTISLSQLDATKASNEAFEFEYVRSNDLRDRSTVPEDQKIYLTVLGGQSETVTQEVAKLVNERRRLAAQREVAQKVGVGKKKIEFNTMESDVEFGQRLASVRLVGWRGITEPWSPENALRLCRSNQEIASEVTLQSDEMGNFIKS